MSSIGCHSNIQTQPSKRIHSLYTPYPQVVPHVLPHLCCMGVKPRTLRSSSLRASNPWLEPGDLPLLTEAMDSTDCFSAMDGLKQTVLSRPPFVESACRRSPLRDYPDCPTLRPVFPILRSEAKVPSLSFRYAHACLSATLGLRIACGNARASLTRWAVGVCDADTCGRRILLDYSGALQKRRRLASS